MKSFLHSNRFRIIGMLALLTIVFAAPTAHGQDKKKRETGPTLVKTDTVAMKPRATSQTFVGTLEPIRRSVIGSAVEERVDEVPVEEGDFVALESDSGEKSVLVQLQRQTIDIDVAAARIELELREKAMDELAATIPTQVEAATAEVGRLDVQLSYAQKAYDRMQGLASGGSMSDKEMEESVSLFNSATQASIVAKAELQRLKATREIRLTIAKRNVARQEAELQRTLDQQSKHTVFAPFSGYVTRKIVERGTWVTRGTPLVELVQLDPIELRIQVPQEYTTILQRSFDSANKNAPLSASIEIDSIEQPIQGTVVRIIPDADPRTRSLPVIIRIDNPVSGQDGTGGHLLKPGLLARAHLEIGEGLPVLMVPKDALVLNQGTTTIYLVDRSGPQPVVRQKVIKTGNSNGNWIEVIGQLKAGDEIVVQGNERLRNGEEVKVIQ